MPSPEGMRSGPRSPLRGSETAAFLEAEATPARQSFAPADGSPEKANFATRVAVVVAAVDFAAVRRADVEVVGNATLAGLGPDGSVGSRIEAAD